MTDSLLYTKRAFYSVLVVLPEPGDSRFRRLFSCVLDFFIFVCLLHVIFNDLFTGYYYFGAFPVGFILSTLSGDFCGLGIRITLIMKGKIIVHAMNRIFSSQLVSKTKKAEYATLTVAYCACWAIPIAYIYEDVSRLILEDGEEFTQRSIFFGYYWNKTWVTYFAMFLKFVDAHQVYALPFYCVVLCYYACRLLTKAVKRIEKNLKPMRDLEEFFPAFIEVTRKLTRSLEDIEEAMSFLLMLLYSYLMSCIFIVITMMIQIWPSGIDPGEVMSNILAFFVSLSAFLALSVQAANVHNAAVDLKRAIYGFSSKLPFPLRNEEENVLFLLLTMANAFEKQTVVSVWNLFDLNRSFILQTSGAIISYAALLLHN